MLVSLRGNKSERSAQRHGRRGQRTSTTRQATAFAQVLRGAAHAGDGAIVSGRKHSWLRGGAWPSLATGLPLL